MADDKVKDPKDKQPEQVPEGTVEQPHTPGKKPEYKKLKEAGLKRYGAMNGNQEFYVEQHTARAEYIAFKGVQIRVNYGYGALPLSYQITLASKDKVMFGKLERLINFLEGEVKKPAK